MRHLVEGLGEARQVALGAAHRHLDEEIAGGDEVGGADQTANRRDQAIGEIDAEPDRREQHGQRDHRIEQRKRHLHADAALLQAAIIRNRGSRLVEVLDDAGINRARDIEEEVAEILERDDRPDEIGVVRQVDQRLVFGRILDGEVRRHREFAPDADGGAVDHGEVALDHHGGGQAAHRRLGGHGLAETAAVLVPERADALQVARHAHDVAANRIGMLAHIGLRYRHRIIDDGAGAHREPAVEAAIERDARQQRDQDGRDHGDDAEQRHHPHMQAGGRPAPPPRLDDAPHLAADDADEHQRHRAVEAQHGDDDFLRRHQRGDADQHDEAHQSGDERHQHRERRQAPQAKAEPRPAEIRSVACIEFRRLRVGHSPPSAARDSHHPAGDDALGRHWCKNVTLSPPTGIIPWKATISVT